MEILEMVETTCRNTVKTLCVARLLFRFWPRGIAPLVYANARCARGSRWGIKATRCENETAEPRSVFWTIGQRRRKEPARVKRVAIKRERERKKKNRDGKKEKSKRKSFPLVERNTHRFATIQRFTRARARYTAKRHIMQRASSLTQLRARSVQARDKDCIANLSKIRASRTIRIFVSVCEELERWALREYSNKSFIKSIIFCKIYCEI